jgi:LytS/YehU family sensor histidine kinase
VGLAVDFLYTSGVIQTPVQMFMPLILLAFAIIIVLVHAMDNAVLQKEALSAAKLETELADANMSIMLSQIQPHFLYNALNTIKYLVRRDTEMAEKAIVEFSLYLRGNMDSLTQKKPIPFRTELSHIRHYCEIEKMRFGQKLEIEYDIETDNFFVPTLSIQPLVENSIKHGVTKKPDGGTVTIHTFEDENNYYVEIKDDGIGFDPNNPIAKDPSSANRSHVGFSNIKSRLETMLDAKIKVKSEIDKGTDTLITLPKKSNFGENENTINY